MNRTLLGASLMILSIVACGGTAEAGRIHEALSQAGDGTVRFAYPVREGVNAGERNWVVEDGVWIHQTGHPCTDGPMVAELRVHRGRATHLRLNTDCRTGRTPEGTIDLGAVSPGEASEFLLALAWEGDEDVAEDAVFGASVVAGVEVWPELLKLSRDGDRPEDVREAAVFWLGQAAAREATAGLTQLVEDDSEEIEIREAALFALSQRPESEGFPVLMRAARENPHPQLREMAMFWLAQLEDPRVVDFFETILLGR